MKIYGDLSAKDIQKPKKGPVKETAKRIYVIEEPEIGDVLTEEEIRRFYKL